MAELHYIIVLELIKIVVFGIILLIVRSYLPTYLKEKGKNLATKEDVGEITDKIEWVRSQYTADLEKLKAYLKVVTEQQAVLQEKANESLLKFFEDCLVLLHEKLLTNLGNFPFDRGKSLFDYQNSVNRLCTEILLGYVRLLLYFFDNNQIVSSAGSLAQVTLGVRKVFRKRFPDVKRALLEEELAVGKNDYHLKVNQTNIAVQEYNREIGVLYNEKWA